MKRNNYLQDGIRKSIHEAYIAYTNAGMSDKMAMKMVNKYIQTSINMIQKVNER